MFRSATTLVFLALSATLIACGGSSSSSGSNGAGGSSGTGTSQSFQCCLNGDYYDCPSESAMNTCFNNSDPSGCTHTHTDPSGMCN
jgi:hypothetical protein